MRKLRVLIVDDSIVMRRLLADALAADPALEVAGTASNGRIALAKLTQLNPDVVTLDVEMPELDGLETLAALRQTHPRLPVIMFSTQTSRGAEATLDALALGANDYVAKPSHAASVEESLQGVRQQLIPKIKALCAAGKPPADSAHRPSPRQVDRPKASRPIELIVVAVSTGGPNALAALLPELPVDLPAPIVIVQHMPPVFTRHLAERLDKVSALEVVEAVGGESLRPGGVWIAPGDFHLCVRRTAAGLVLETNQDPPENSCRPSADVLFRSAAEACGAATLGVVLTGMGHDGLRGCQALHDVGAAVLVQDEATSVVWGMPGAVAQAGLADEILPIDELPRAIQRAANRFRVQLAGTS